MVPSKLESMMLTTPDTSVPSTVATLSKAVPPCMLATARAENRVCIGKIIVDDVVELVFLIQLGFNELSMRIFFA